MGWEGCFASTRVPKEILSQVDKHLQGIWRIVGTTWEVSQCLHTECG
jgi:hypothetical protein